MRRLRRLLFILVLAVLALVGVALVKVAYGDIAFARENRSWPAAKGKLLAVGVKETDRSGRTEFVPFLRYAYEVEGHQFEGHVLSHLVMPRLATRREAEKVIAPYSSGQTLTVHYDPEDPSRSCLVQGDTGGSTMWAMLLVGLALILGGTYASVGRLLMALLRRSFSNRHLNVALEAPWGWQRIKTSKSDGPLALWGKGRLRCALNAKASTRDVLPTPASVANTRRRIILDVSSEHRIVREAPHSAHGHEGILIEIEVTESGRRYRYTGFCSAARGFEREILVYGPPRALTSERASKILDQFIERLRVLDPDRTSYANEIPTRLPWSSATYGYTLAAPSAPWRKWRKLPSDMPMAEFGLFHEKALSLAILPTRLPKENLPAEALQSGLLSLYGLDLSTPSLRRRPRDDGRVVYECQREFDEMSYAYRFHVRTWPGGAALLALVGEPGNPALDDVSEQLVTAFETPTESPRAFDPETESETTRLREAKVFEGIGDWFFHRDRYEEAEACYTQVVRRAPDDARYLSSLLLIMARLERHEEGLALVEQNRKRFPDDLFIASFAPFFLSQSNRKDEALTLYADLFDRGWRNERDAEDFIEILIEKGRLEEARHRIEAFRESGDEVWVRKLASRLLRAEEDFDGAVANLRKYVDLHPGDREGRVALVDELIACQDAEEAVKLCDDVLSGHPNDAAFFLKRGIAECHLGRFPHAKRSFASAQRLSPRDPVIGEWLRHAEQELGQGSQHLLRRPIQPIDLPPWDSPSAEDLASYRDEPLVYVDTTTVFDYRKGESLRWTTRDVALVRTSRGAQELSTLYIPFDPESCEVHVNEVRVRDAEGGTVWTGSLEDYFVKDDASDSGSTKKVVHVPVEGLAPGRTVELTRTFRIHGAPQKFHERRVGLGQRRGVLRARVEVRGDVSDLATRTAGEVQTSRDDSRIRFSAVLLPAYPVEPFSPPAHRWQPTVWISESEESWEDVARDYLKKIEERFEPQPTIDALAEEITRDADSSETRTAAIVSWVRKSLSYKSLAFGPRAWMPERADKVVEARWGDCKGHAILLHHLMRAAGERCHLALISTSDDIWPEEPSRWQFDHMINEIPDLDGGRFVDTVDKGAGVDLVTPSGLAGQTALILDPDAPRLVTLPRYPATDNRVEMERDCVIQADGTLHMTETLRVHANLGGYLRQWLASSTPAERRERVESVLHRLDSRFQLEEIDTEHVDDADGPTTIRTVYVIVRALEEIEGGLVGSIPSLWEREYLLPPVSSDRRAPLEIAMPIAFETRIRIHGDQAGRSVTTKSEDAESAENPFVRWDRTLEKNDGAIHLKFQAQMLEGLHPPAAYQTFRTAALTALDALQVRIVAQ